MNLKEIFNLLERANANGVKIALDKENLLVKMKSANVDNSILENIKTHKEQLIRYFQQTEQESDNSFKKLNNERDLIEYNGDSYYSITPVQYYWVSDEMDKEYKQIDKVHGSVFIKYHLKGEVDWNAFQKAYQYVIARHESLRTTFHSINGEYLMKVETESISVYKLELNDIRQNPRKEIIAEELADFCNHKFDLNRGPLVVARLIHTDENKYIVAIKIHHVIFDSWSEGILLRDLLSSYIAIKKSKTPSLPILHNQLKECLTVINAYSRTERDYHRNYWKNLYQSLPEEMIIPGAKRNTSSIHEKICKTEQFSLPKDLVKVLTNFSRQFSTSLFVILQAAFNSFFRDKTGLNDIVIGTYVFGRDYSECEHQIGCFAKTVLIRTILKDQDDFNEVIMKVKKSNEDTKLYTAFTLIDAFFEMLYPSKNINGTFWKINMQYNTISKSQLQNSVIEDKSEDRLDLEFVSGRRKVNTYIASNMQLNFSQIDQNIKLLVEYDSSLFDANAIKKLIGDYLTYMNEVIRF